VEQSADTERWKCIRILTSPVAPAANAERFVNKPSSGHGEARWRITGELLKALKTLNAPWGRGESGPQDHHNHQRVSRAANSQDPRTKPLNLVAISCTARRMKRDNKKS